MNTSQRNTMLDLQAEVHSMQTTILPTVKIESPITISPKPIIENNSNNLITILSNKISHCKSYSDSIQSAENILKTHKQRIQEVKSEIMLITEDSQRNQFMGDIIRLEKAEGDLKLFIIQSAYKTLEDNVVMMIEKYQKIASQDPFDVALTDLANNIISVEKILSKTNTKTQENLMNLDIALFQKYSEYISPQEESKNIFKRIFSRRTK